MNIPLFKVYMSDRVDKPLLKQLHSGWIGQGERVKEFEYKLAKKFYNENVLTTSAGTHALTLALRLCDVKPHDVVVSTPLTCLSYLTSIETDRGFETIGKIVNQKLDVKVKSLNQITGEIEWKRVTNWIKLASDDVEWYNIYLEYGNNSRSKIGKRNLWITGDHKLLTNNGWKRVDELEYGIDKIATDYKKPNKKQMEFINGTMLGDGHIQKTGSGSGRLHFSHCGEQKEWIEFKKKALKGLEPKTKPNKISNSKSERIQREIQREIQNEKEIKIRKHNHFNKDTNKNKIGYAFETSNSLFFKELRKKWYSKNWKNRNHKIVPDIEITPLTLATMYMDDGSLIYKSPKEYTVVLCTECFSFTFLWKLFYKLVEYGIKCTVAKKGNGHRIYIGKGYNYCDDIPVNKFLKIVSPYIIPSMRNSKLPLLNYELVLDDFDPELWNLGEAETHYTDIIVNKGKPPKSHKPKYVYCLEVEDNHNFISKNIVLSNCTATNMPILQQGANIAWADVKDDFNIDPESIEKVIESYGRKPKAIVVVHWGGYPVDLEEIRQISNYYDIPLIEDAAHAYGSTYMGSYVGENHWSDFTMFSFQAIKHLTSVDGGCLFCADEKDYERGKLLRWYGIDRESKRTDFRCENDIIEWGYKFHMNDICALIGMYNMDDIDANIEKARHIARIYDEELSKIDGITLTQTSTDRLSSYWLYTMMVENRSEFCYMMGSKGIAVSRVHERNDKHTFSQRFRTELPNLEKVIQKQICIPIGWWLSEEDVTYIINSIKGGW